MYKAIVAPRDLVSHSEDENSCERLVHAQEKLLLKEPEKVCSLNNRRYGCLRKAKKSSRLNQTPAKTQHLRRQGASWCARRTVSPIVHHLVRNGWTKGREDRKLVEGGFV